MGNVGSWVTTITDPPGINPGPDAKPTFDPMYGFKNGRKERGKTSNILGTCVKSRSQIKSVWVGA